MRVFIAAPYSSDPEANVQRAISEATKLLDAGYTVFLPHLFHFWNAVTPRDYHVWTQLDLEWLKVCDVLIRLSGASPGADAEVALARELRLPIYASVEAFLRVAA